MSELRRFLKRRILEVEAQLDALQKEYAELLAARDALPKTLPGMENMDRRRSDELAALSASSTIKEKALYALSTRPKGGTTNEIIDFIFDDFGVDIPRTSLSPQLSKLNSAAQISQTTSGRFRITEPGRRALANILEGK